MPDDFFLVHRSILPECFPKVIEAREMIAHDGVSVSEACKSSGISRSVYYKYKDKVFLPVGKSSRKAILSFKTEDCPGVLSSILLLISQSHANVLTISQDMPIQGLAYIHLMLNVKTMAIGMDKLLEELGKLDHVKKVEVLTYE
jgi:chorismate mutase